MEEVQGPVSGLTTEQINTAMQSPEHMKRWLAETGRRFLTLNAIDLIDALPWPQAVEALMQILDAYRDHRRAIQSGRTEKMRLETGDTVDVPVMKTEFLEIEELDRAVRDLVSTASKLDPSWSLENPAL